MTGNIAWIAYQEDQRWANESLHTGGRISGYAFYDGGTGKNPERYAGYYANITFPTPVGQRTIRSNRRYNSPEDQKAMLGWEVDVQYFPGQWDRARVMQWSKPTWPETIPLFAGCVAGMLWMAWMLLREWRDRKPNTRPS